jgi:hypothetical protein
VAFVDEGYTGEKAALVAEGEVIRLEVIKLPDVKKGLVLLPRRGVVERSFGWAARFRQLARDYERLPETLIGLHFLALAIRMAKPVIETMLIVPHYCYNYLVPNLEFQESFHAYYPFRRR